MQSIENTILASIKKCGRGNLFFAQDFSSKGSALAIQKSLERLVEKKILVRVARGIYYYPKHDKVLGIDLLPTYEHIAMAIAKRDKARIVPTGLYALNRLGLSTQVPTSFVYLTDGTPRNIHIADGYGIEFRKAPLKTFAYHNELLRMIVLALKTLGQENITSVEERRIKELMQLVSETAFKQDCALMPIWIRTYLSKFYE